ncbi:hypothetical protein FGO68_gene14125 [Halteria grandinella]|uniref:Uncharacterized protein n=1 Tax=Halteria grandinella TaxID=5974 RepID=A0A8J8T9Z7_HALGN|nr:hypothetical protein FGO68_gene14125 [Halteria grandinella]
MVVGNLQSSIKRASVKNTPNAIPEYTDEERQAIINERYAKMVNTEDANFPSDVKEGVIKQMQDTQQIHPQLQRAINTSIKVSGFAEQVDIIIKQQANSMGNEQQLIDNQSKSFVRFCEIFSLDTLYQGQKVVSINQDAFALFLMENLSLNKITAATLCKNLLDDLMGINALVSGRGQEYRNQLIPADYQNLVHLKNYYNSPTFLDQFLTSQEGQASLKKAENRDKLLQVAQQLFIERSQDASTQTTKDHMHALIQTDYVKIELSEEETAKRREIEEEQRKQRYKEQAIMVELPDPKFSKQVKSLISDIFEGSTMLQRNLHKAETSLDHINGFKDFINDVQFQVTNKRGLSLSEIMKEGIALIGNEDAHRESQRSGSMKMRSQSIVDKDASENQGTVIFSKPFVQQKSKGMQVDNETIINEKADILASETAKTIEALQKFIKLSEQEKTSTNWSSVASKKRSPKPIDNLQNKRYEALKKKRQNQATEDLEIQELQNRYLNDFEIFPHQKERSLNPGDLNRMFRKLDKNIRRSVKTPNIGNHLSVFSKGQQQRQSLDRQLFGDLCSNEKIIPSSTPQPITPFQQHIKDTLNQVNTHIPNRVVSGLLRYQNDTQGESMIQSGSTIQRSQAEIRESNSYIKSFQNGQSFQSNQGLKFGGTTTYSRPIAPSKVTLKHLGVQIELDSASSPLNLKDHIGKKIDIIARPSTTAQNRYGHRKGRSLVKQDYLDKLNNAGAKSQLRVSFHKLNEQEKTISKGFELGEKADL